MKNNRHKEISGKEVFRRIAEKIYKNIIRQDLFFGSVK